MVPRTPRPAAHLPGWLLCAIGTAAGLGAVQVQAQPSQRPLLVSSTGAKPNIVVSLDNSGSMAIPYPDGYDVSRPGWRGLPTGDDGQPMFEAQRSPDVNPMYYNPRITYRPRVDAKGEPLQANDGIQFISNASSAAFSYKVFADPMDPAGARWWSIFGAVYFFVAVKRVRGMRLLGPAWKPRRATSAAPVSVANRH